MQNSARHRDLTPTRAPWPNPCSGRPLFVTGGVYAGTGSSYRSADSTYYDAETVAATGALVDAAHRKVVQYVHGNVAARAGCGVRGAQLPAGPGDKIDSEGHGTHVCGSGAGEA